jgi:hypothetical protein
VEIKRSDPKLLVTRDDAITGLEIRNTSWREDISNAMHL